MNLASTRQNHRCCRGVKYRPHFSSLDYSFVTKSDPKTHKMLKRMLLNQTKQERVLGLIKKRSFEPFVCFLSLFFFSERRSQLFHFFFFFFFLIVTKSFSGRRPVVPKTTRLLCCRKNQRSGTDNQLCGQFCASQRSGTG